MINVYYRISAKSLVIILTSCLEKCIQNIDNFRFFIIAHSKVNTVIFFNSIDACLYIAAHSNNNGIRVFFLGLMGVEFYSYAISA